MDKATITELEKMTGFTFKTIKSRLSDLQPSEISGLFKYYQLREALPKLYNDKQSAVIGLSEARAKLADVQAKKVELEILKMQEDLVDGKMWARLWGKRVTGCKDRLLNMALHISEEVTACNDQPTNYETIIQRVHEAISEIAGDH